MRNEEEGYSYIEYKTIYEAWCEIQDLRLEIESWKAVSEGLLNHNWHLSYCNGLKKDICSYCQSHEKYQEMFNK